jgi:hypothetical protein
MIKRYNNLSFLFFIPGVIAQVAGIILLEEHVPPESLGILASFLVIGGTLMAITGFAFYAKAKGRSPLWGVAGFIGLPGLLLLAVLKDRSGDPWNT